MTTTTNETKTDYLLLFRGDEWDQGLSPEELQKVMNNVMGWFEGLCKQGRVVAGQPLARSGKTVSARNGAVIDGPFMESKEAIGGYLLIHAANLEEATAIARSNPTLAYGITIDVRPVLEECPIFARHKVKVNFSK